MRDTSSSMKVRGALLVLESTAARAGYAMACPFGSSAEFEAAVIRGKIEAGVYGRKRYRRYILAAAVASVLLAAVLWF
jgi:hypothetical protein